MHEKLDVNCDMLTGVQKIIAKSGNRCHDPLYTDITELDNFSKISKLWCDIMRNSATSLISNVTLIEMKRVYGCIIFCLRNACSGAFYLIRSLSKQHTGHNIAKSISTSNRVFDYLF